MAKTTKMEKVFSHQKLVFVENLLNAVIREMVDRFKTLQGCIPDVRVVLGHLVNLTG